MSPRWPLAGYCYQLPPQYLCIPGKSIWAGLDLNRVGSIVILLNLASEVRMGYRNPAHLEVGPYAVYLYLFYSLCNSLHFIYVPVTGRISPGTDRNPVGPLPMHSSSAGGPTRARDGRLKGRGTTFRCRTSAFQARASGRDPTYTA